MTKICTFFFVRRRVASSLFGVCRFWSEVPHPVEGSEVETSTLCKRSEAVSLQEAMLLLCGGGHTDETRRP